MDVHPQRFVGEIDKPAWAHGWIWSVVSHAILVTTLIVSVQSIQVVQETFQWNVELVSNGSSASQPSEATAETSLREDASSRAATPATRQTEQRPQTEHHMVGVSAARSDPSIQKRSSSLASKSKEPVLESSAMREPVLMAEPTTPVTKRAPQHAEVSTKPSELAESPSDSVLSGQSVSEPQIASPPSDTRPFDSNERRPSSSDPAQGSEIASSPPQNRVLNERAVMASRTSSVGEAKRPDYGWLAAALRARIEEIKWYSEQARSNGWEGRVVVATTVTADGRLMDIRVVESSGHGSLDEDAKHILRDASPMVLVQPLGAVHVTVKVPIVFGLH